MATPSGRGRQLSTAPAGQIGNGFIFPLLVADVTGVDGTLIIGILLLK